MAKSSQATSTPSTNELKIKKLKQQVLIAVAIAAVVVSFSLVFMKFLYDLWAYNARVQSAQRETKSALEHNLETYEGLSQWYTVLEQAEGTVTEPNPGVVVDALPDKYDFPALVSSVKKLADASNVDLIEFVGIDEEGSVPDRSPQPAPYDIDFGIEVRGDYGQISEFVNTLDQSIRPFSVSKMELRGSDDALRADISLKTYFQPGVSLDYPERSVR